MRLRECLGSARTSRALSGALAGKFPSSLRPGHILDVFVEGGEHSTRGRVRSPELQPTQLLARF
jgi:hypothetical protein